MEEDIEILEKITKYKDDIGIPILGPLEYEAIRHLIQAYKEDKAVMEKLKRQAQMTAEEFEKVHNLLDKTIELILDDLSDNGYTKEELFRSYENRAKAILESEAKDEQSR